LSINGISSLDAAQNKIAQSKLGIGRGRQRAARLKIATAGYSPFQIQEEQAFPPDPSSPENLRSFAPTP
jgi:hypothetical protein